MVGTMKITTLSSALNEGVVDLFKDSFYDSGSIEIDGSHLHCWKRVRTWSRNLLASS